MKNNKNKKELKSIKKETPYGLRFSFKFLIWGVEIWQKGWLER
jgi:hypothetical protein